MDYTVEQYDDALKRASEAGDQAAIDDLTRRREETLARMKPESGGALNKQPSVEQLDGALSRATQAGDQAAIDDLQQRRDQAIGKGLGGPALSREQRENRIADYDSQLSALQSPKVKPVTGADRMDTGAGTPMAATAIDRPGVSPTTDSKRALGVGALNIPGNYFKRRDADVATRRDIYDHVFEQLPAAEQDRLRKPKKWLGRHDSYHDMSPNEFLHELSKAGYGQDEIKEMVGSEDMWFKLTTGQFGSTRGTVYKDIIQPAFTKDGVLPSKRLADEIARIKQGYSEESKESLAKPFVSKNAELWSPTTWFDETTKAPWEDWDGFWLSFLENAPQHGVSLATTRGAGTLGAALSTLKNIRAGTKVSTIEKARKVAAGRAGMGAGMATEGVLIRDAVYTDTAEKLMQLPEEKWQANPEYLDMIDAGYDPETVKQIIANETANHAGSTAMLVSGAMGAPMSYVIGRTAAGSLTEGMSGLAQVGVGFAGEATQEGAQEFMENLVSNLNVKRIDPEQSLFEGGAESFFGGAFLGGPGGAIANLPALGTPGIDKDLKNVMKLTEQYTSAANDRYKFQNTMIPEDDDKLSPQERVDRLQQLEHLQRKEAEALIKAEPAMRAHLKKVGGPDAEAQLVMIDRLKMRANALLTDIEVAKSKRMTAAQMWEQERLIQKERAEIQRRVDENILKRDEVSAMANAIEGVQNWEVVSDADKERLTKAGYGRENADGRYVILPKGARALKELRRQEESLQKKLDSGYTGSERRDPNRSARRAAIERADESTREEMIYTDHLTNLPNKRAFEEREVGKQPESESANRARIVVEDSTRQIEEAEAVDDAIKGLDDRDLERNATQRARPDGRVMVTGLSDAAIESLTDAGLVEQMDRPDGQGTHAVWTDAAHKQIVARDKLGEAQRMLEMAQRRLTGEGSAPVVAAVDVDSLKWVNDNMGHVAGDRLLQAVSDALSRQKGVKAYRLGGDEFAVTGATEEQVETAMQAAADELAGMPIRFGQDEVTPSITWGKGKTYDEADAEANTMKQERQRAGKRAQREKPPPSYRVTSQTRFLFHSVDDAKAARDHLIEMDPVAVGNPEWKDLSRADRLKAMKAAYQKHSQATTADGKPVRLSLQGFRKSRHHGFDDQKMSRSVAVLPELIETATLLATNKADASDSKTKHVRAFHMYGSKVEIDGKDYYVKLVIREDNDGSFVYYDHDLTEASTITDKKAVETVRTQLPTMRQWWQSVDTKKPIAARADLYKGLPSQWNLVRDQVTRGDEVEIVTPDGAVMGVVSKVRKRKGKDRLHVSIEGRHYVFNPDRNWLITPEFEEDLDWLLQTEPGDITFAPPSNVIPEVSIGALSRDDVIYADLDGYTQQLSYPKTSPWIDPAWTANRGWLPGMPFVPAKWDREATDEEVAHVENYWRELKQTHRNLPNVTIVRSTAELAEKAPHILEQMIAQGASASSVRGAFDEQNPNNGIVLLVHNIANQRDFGFAMRETILHELMGHYGIRGVFGDEAELRQFTNEIIERFPRLAESYAKRIGKNLAIPTQRQTVGEEMLAYVTGQMLAGTDNAPLTKPQRNFIQRFFDWVRDWMARHNWPGGKRDVRGQDSDAGFWSDEQIQALVSRAQDVVRHGQSWNFTYLDGSKVRMEPRQMRDADIFSPGLLTAVRSATKTLTKNERKQLVQRYAPDPVPKEVPLFPEQATVGGFLAAIQDAKKQGLMTARELELSGIEAFLNGLTYQTLANLGGYEGVATSSWEATVKTVLAAAPPATSKQFTEALGTLKKLNDMPQDQHPVDWMEQYTAAKAIVDGILQAPLDPKKTMIPKRVLENYMESDGPVTVRVQPSGGYPSNPDWREMITWLGLNPDEIDTGSIPDELKQRLLDEKKIAAERGVDIGFREDAKKWIEYNHSYTHHAGWQTIGSNKSDYQETFLIQEGGGLDVGRTTHFNHDMGVFAHMRHSTATFAKNLLKSLPIPKARNPAMDGKASLLIELQSDWFQSLRKRWSSQADYEEGSRLTPILNHDLTKALGRFGESIAGDYSTALRELMDGIINYSPKDFEQWLSENPEHQSKVLADQEVEFWQHKVDELRGQLGKAHTVAVDLHEKFRKESPRDYFELQQLDARASDALDKGAARVVAYYLERGLTDLINRIDYANVTSAKTLIALRDSLVNDAALTDLVYFLNNTVSRPKARLPLAQPLLKKMLTEVGEPMGITAEEINATMDTLNTPTQSRVIIVADPQGAFKTPAQAPELFAYANPTNTLKRMLGLLDEGNAPQHIRDSVTVEGASNSVTIRIKGDEAFTAEVADWIRTRIQLYVQHDLPVEYAAQRQSMATKPSTNYDDYDLSLDWDAFEQLFDGATYDAENSAHSSYFDRHSLTTYAEFEEQNEQNYRLTDEDGDDDGVDLDAIREDWENDGGSMLTEYVWPFDAPVDEDGDPIADEPDIRLEKDYGDHYKLFIDDAEVWSDWRAPWAHPSAFMEMKHAILDWVNENNVPVSEGRPFGLRPDRTPEQPKNRIYEYMAMVGTDSERDAMGQRIVAALQDKGMESSESAVEAKKKLDYIRSKGDSIGTASPLSKDEVWRTTALRFLLADAVRRGLPAIVWQPGEATTARGGAYLDGIATDEIGWEVQEVEIGGKVEEVVVITSADTKPIMVNKANSIMILGSTVTDLIEQQRAGKSGLSEKSKPSENDYLTSTAGNYHVVKHRIAGHTLGFYDSAEAAKAAISEAVAKQEGGKGGKGGDAARSGKITAEQIGGPIRIIGGHAMTTYHETFETPDLAGSRYSYEYITPKIWNKELKQYGVQVTEHYIELGPDQAKAQGQQGALIMPRVNPDVEATWGKVEIRELTGSIHGWVIVSPKVGPLATTIFNSKTEAEFAYGQIRKDKFGDITGGGKVFMIEINDKIVEDYENKPKAPFHFDPHNEPVLKSALDKIGQEDKPSLRERLADWRREWKDEFHQGMFDKFYGIKRALNRAGHNRSAENNPYVQVRLTTSHDSQMKAVLEYGHPIWKDGVMQVEGKGLLEILQPVANDIDTWCLYMAGVRAKRLMEEGREKLFTDEEIKAMVALGDANPVLKQVAAEYAAFNKKILDFAEQAGAINKDTRAMWENADYVPFYRVQDDRLVGPLSKSSGIGNLTKPIRRLKGSEANVGDIMQNIMINVSRLVDTSMKNHAQLMAIDALLDSGIVQKKPMTLSQEMIPLQQVKKLLLDRGMNPDAIPEDALVGFQRMFAIQPPEGPGVISVLRNGKKEYYYTDDELLYRSMSMINMHQFGGWMNLLRAPKRLLTSLVTLDPGFMIANYMRDSLSAFVLGRDKFIPVIGALEGFTQALLKDDDMKVMLSAGAAFESGYINANDPESTRRLIKKAMKNKSFAQTLLTSPAKLYEAWRAIGSATENANRMAVYNAALRAGKSHAQALYEAKDLMDFSMSGDWPFIQFLIQTVPFMGARMQGLHRLGRGVHEHPVAFTIKGTLVGLAGLALWFAFRDDERYKELEDWDKRTYFHFWIGEQHYRLPKPFEVGAIFNTIPELFFGAIFSKENDKGQHLLKQFGYMLAETFNMNPIPQAVRPLAESYFNYNWFTGRDIVSPYEEQRMPPEQYRNTTSPTMVQLARSLPGELDTVSGKIRSPLHLQNLYHGYTGTLGRYFLMASDAMLRQAMDMPDPPAKHVGDYPVIGRFLRGDDPRRTVYEQKTYDLIRKVTQVQGSVRYLAKTGQLDRMDQITEEQMPYVQIAGPLEDIRQQVTDINNNVMQIYLDPKMSPEDKREQLDYLQEEKNELFKQGYELRPGSSLHDPGPLTQENIEDLLNKFGVDEVVTAQIKDARPATANLLESIDTLSKKNLEALAKAAQ